MNDRQDDTRPTSPPVDRNYKTPGFEVPPGACDCHFHFIGPQSQFPLRPNHVFGHLDFEDTTIDDWLAMQDALGLSRGLHVQSMMYGQNYELLLHGQCRFPDRLRAVAIPWAGITDRELQLLSDNGVVGARFTWRLENRVDIRLRDRCAAFGWAPHYLIRVDEMTDDWKQAVQSSPGEFVIEHMGSPAPDKGPDSEGFRFVQECLDTGRCWVKLSPRFSAEETFPFSDTDAYVRTLVDQAPDRLLWGSDWPHPQYFRPMPNDGDLLDMMVDWAPDQAVRKMILVDNPARAFGFPPL